MQIGNIKFFNNFDDIIQLPSADFADHMCTHYRKRSLDYFHLELKSRMHDDDANHRISVMLECGFDYPSYPFGETSTNQVLTLRDEFKRANGIKIQISEYMMEIDLQVFKTIPSEHFFYDKACKLLDRQDLLYPDTRELFDKHFVRNRNEKPCFIDMYIRQNRNTDKILLVPINCFDHIKMSGVLDDRRQDLIESRVHFVPFIPAVDLRFEISEDVIVKKERPFDCLLAGSLNAFVYPYRHAAFKIIERMNRKDIIIERGSKMTFFNKTPEITQKYLKKEITHRERDEQFNELAIAQMNDYISRISNSKIAVVCSSVFGYPLKKYFEYMSLGCVIVGDAPKYATELGFKHMENIYICEIDEIEKAVMYLLQNDELRIRLALNAKKLIDERYTTKSRVDLFLKQIEETASIYE